MLIQSLASQRPPNALAIVLEHEQLRPCQAPVGVIQAGAMHPVNPPLLGNGSSTRTIGSVGYAAMVVLARTAAGCALALALIWLAVWLHQSMAHGTTSVNEMRVVLGLTWMDAAKAPPFAVLLLLPGFGVLVRRARADCSPHDGSRTRW